MENYEINEETLALIPYDKGTMIYEYNKQIFINKDANDIIYNSCEYFGSTYEGRRIGTIRLTGMTHKLPVIIEESRRIIFFPTSSPRLNKCTWLSLRNIKNIEKFENKTKIIFKNYKEIVINSSFSTINNQLLRACRLESVLINRK